MIYRCKYSKLGDMCYIAHLDLLRIFIRSLRRAAIQVNYSQGFNPHAKISFSPALGLGIESLAEVIDIDAEELITEKEMIERLNRALPEGIEILDCSILEKAKSIPTTMTHSLYEYSLKSGKSGLDSVIEDVKNKEEIIISKKTKKNPAVETNVRDRIYDIYTVENKVYAILQNSIEGALKPTEFVDILKMSGMENLEVDRIKKIESYYIDEKGKKLV